MSAALASSSCSLLLDFTECEVDTDCGGVACVDGICQGNDAITVSGDIRQDTVWDSERDYQLDGLVYVQSGVTLTIRSGTKILGDEGSALVVERGGQLLAQGRADDPIVFTSARAEGDRAPGDWGGITLLGSAPVNEPNAIFEGLSDSSRAVYGGEDASSSCGVLEYVRVEFGGFPIQKDKELNGLTLAGCGEGTLVSHVQVHRGDDDGVEIFGGAVKLDHVVISQVEDDGLDWDRGWTGTGQFIVIQQGRTGDNGIEADNWEGAPDNSPRSAPRLYNVSIIGSPQGSTQRAITFKAGTAGTIANMLVMGQPTEAIDVQGVETVAQAQGEALRVSHSLFFDIGATGEHYLPTPGEETDMVPGEGRDDDGGFDEEAHFERSELGNIFGRDPQLGDPFNLTAPNWVPANVAGVSAGIAPPTGFDESATYFGAFDPNQSPGEGLWTDGWTDFPSN